MLRTKLVRAVESYLSSKNLGGITLRRESDERALDPPYAIVRVGESEEMFPGQADIEDVTILVGVFFDSDASTSADAEQGSEAVFSGLRDWDAVTASLDNAGLVVSEWQDVSRDFSIEETRWQHVLSCRFVGCEEFV